MLRGDKGKMLLVTCRFFFVYASLVQTMPFSLTTPSLAQETSKRSRQISLTVNPVLLDDGKAIHAGKMEKQREGV